MSLLITKISVGFDKFILKIYAKTKLGILRSYLQKRAVIHTKIIIKISKEIINNGSENDKREVLKILRNIFN
ncbi:hypothetical protein ACTFJW_04330 [Clostridium cagae]|uniref:hypothetical protein n=1 Tax=Clostridium cagae TaxID=2080751 RepID=UPI003F76966D